MSTLNRTPPYVLVIYRPIAIKRVMLWACVLFLFLCSASGNGASEDITPFDGNADCHGDSRPLESGSRLYIGVKHTKLFKLLDHRFDERVVTSSGVDFVLSEQTAHPNEVPHILQLSLAVLPSIEDAKQLLADWTRLISIGHQEQGNDFASWYAVWFVDDDFCTLVLREDNVAISFHSAGKAGDAKHLARKIVRILRDNRDVALIGEFATTPTINFVDLVIDNAQGEGILYRFRPESGLSGKISAFTGYATMESTKNQYPAIEVDGGEMIVRFQKPHYDKSFKLSLANLDNLFISKTVSLE